MADTKISGLAALGAAPATGDLFVLVDISDTSMALTGTDKKMTVANLFTSPTLVTPVIGVATGTSLAVTGLLKSSGTAGVGYATGAGGTVAQITSKSTGVTLDKTTGTITLDAEALAGVTAVTFTLTNSTIAATDVVVLSHKSGGTAGSYLLSVSGVGAGSCGITVYNNTAAPLSEAVVLSFAVIKGVAA